MKQRIIVFALTGILFASCAKKTDTTVVADTSARATPATTPVVTDPMKFTGKIDQDMVMMGQMMMKALGAADSNYDDRFIATMIPHHQGAISMAKDARYKATKPKLKNLATAIIAAQEKEIVQMAKWDKQWYAHDPQLDVNLSMRNDHMTEELGAAGKDYEERFIDGMIPHHESAIEMAKDALQKSTHPEIKQLAKNIIASQQAEIDLMKKYRQAWYGH